MVTQCRFALCMLLAGSAAATARAQTVAPEVFVAAGLASDGRQSPRAVAWSGAATVVSPSIDLGRQWDFDARAGIAREPVVAMAFVDRVVPAYLDAVRISTSLTFD